MCYPPDGGTVVRAAGKVRPSYCLPGPTPLQRSHGGSGVERSVYKCVSV